MPNLKPVVRYLTGAGIALTALAVGSPAYAAETFAQFVQSHPGQKIFQYANVSSGPNVATLTTTSGSPTVLVSELGMLASPSTATVNLSAWATALPTLGGGFVSQLFSGSLTFTLLAPQIGLSGPSVNALTVTFTDAMFGGPSGTSAPTLTADESLGSTISYSSDFLDVSGFSDKDFSLSFSGSNRPLILTAGRLSNMAFSGSGTLAGAVPEPASWGMMLLGFGTLGTTLRSQRRKAVPQPA